MFKKVLNAIQTFSLTRVWNWLWYNTNVDEKANAVVEEVKERAKQVQVEVEDVKKEIQEVKKEAKDVLDAAKGKKRKSKKTQS
jgi:phage shock protein A